MGALFEIGDDVVWNPSPRVARSFIAQVRALEDAIGMPSGIGELVADEIRVDPVALRTFVDALAGELDPTRSATFGALVAGPFSIAAGMLAACDASVLMMRGVAGRLARRGAALVSGRARPGTIDDALDEPLASTSSARTIRLPEDEAWRIYLLMEEMNRFLHQRMNYPSTEHVHRWLEQGVFGELSELFYRVIGPWFPVDDDTGLVRGPGGILHGDEPFGPSGITAARKDLRDTLEALSQRALASQWYGDFEYILWDRIGRGTSQLGNITLTADSLAELLELSREAGGWFHFCDDAMSDELVFVHGRDWEAMYEEWLERVPASARPRDR